MSRRSPVVRGWSGGAMVLGKRHPTNFDNSRARAYCVCSRCGGGGGGCLDIFKFVYLFSFLSPSSVSVSVSLSLKAVETLWYNSSVVNDLSINSQVWFVSVARA